MALRGESGGQPKGFREEGTAHDEVQLCLISKKQTQLFDYVDQLIASEAVKYDAGTPIRDGLDRLKAVVDSQRVLADKMKDRNAPENSWAAALYRDGRLRHGKYLRALTVCTEIDAAGGDGL